MDRLLPADLGDLIQRGGHLGDGADPGDDIGLGVEVVIAVGISDVPGDIEINLVVGVAGSVDEGDINPPGGREIGREGEKNHQPGEQQ